MLQLGWSRQVDGVALQVGTVALPDVDSNGIGQLLYERRIRSTHGIRWIGIRRWIDSF